MQTSFSELQTFARCPRKYYYNNVLKLQRKRVALPLALGILMHEALQEYYLGGESAMWQAVEQFEQDYLDKPFVLDDDFVVFEDLLQQTRVMLREYLAYYPNDDLGTVLHVEEQFTLTLASGSVVTFTPDLVVRDADGVVWVVDHKTTGRLPDAGLPYGEMQARLYLAAVRAMYPECGGFIFNYIRKKAPRQPRLNKTAPHWVSDLARVDTTFDILHTFLLEEAPHLLKEPSHRRRLQELYSTNNFFRRVRVLSSAEADAAVVEDTEMWCANMDDAAATGRYPRHFANHLHGIMSCQSCSYLAVCQSDLMGWDTESVILQQYEPLDLSHKNYESEPPDDDDS